MSWCTIESDPGVFTELISLYGCPEVACEEIYSLDVFDQVEEKKVQSFGLVFLFKWKNEVDTRAVLHAADVPDLFFSRQIVQNACASQAILSVLLNSDSLTLGPLLTNFKDFTCMIDPESKGIAIGNSEEIRLAHNSFARPEPFLQDDSIKSHERESEDVYHFIAYLPLGGKVYELDGLKEGPILLGEIDNGADWWTVAKPALESRMSRYSATETHFNLLNICQKRSFLLEKDIARLQNEISSMDVDGDVTIQSEITMKLEQLKSEYDEEIEKQAKQSKENIRRRHNFIPLVTELLKILATEGKVSHIIENSKNRN